MSVTCIPCFLTLLKKKKKLIKEKGSKTRKAGMYHTVIRITEASEMSDVTQSFRFAHVLGIACL